VATRNETALKNKENGAIKNKNWKILMSITSAKEPTKKNLPDCFIKGYFLPIYSVTRRPNTESAGKIIKKINPTLPKRSTIIHATERPQIIAKIISFLSIFLRLIILDYHISFFFESLLLLKNNRNLKMPILYTTLNKVQKFLEWADSYRNKVLYFFIKPFWPRWILPNYISWIRIFISVILFIFIFWLKIEDKILILSLFCFGALTDLIDGPIARSLNKITEFGAMLDPVADKMLIMPIAVYSLFFYHKWLLLNLIIMEIINVLVIIFYKSKKPYTESDIFGKTKMVLQSITFVAILFTWPNSPLQFFINILWLSIPLSILSVFTKLTEVQPAKLKN